MFYVLGLGKDFSVGDCGIFFLYVRNSNSVLDHFFNHVKDRLFSETRA